MKIHGTDSLLVSGRDPVPSQQQFRNWFRNRFTTGFRTISGTVTGTGSLTGFSNGFKKRSQEAIVITRFSHKKKSDSNCRLLGNTRWDQTLNVSEPRCVAIYQLAVGIVRYGPAWLLLSWSYRCPQDEATAFRCILCQVDGPHGLRRSTRQQAGPSNDTNRQQKPMLTRQSRKPKRLLRNGAYSRPPSGLSIWREPRRRFGPRRKSSPESSPKKWVNQSKSRYRS